MSDKNSNSILAEKIKNGDEKAFNELVEKNLGLAAGAARRFTGRGTDYEDLVQIGSIGLIKAAKSFDVSLGFEFSTYAFSMIVGEIRRFLRDDGAIKISRKIKQNCAILLNNKQKYIEKHGREPHIEELADICGITKEDAVLCLGALKPLVSFNGNCEDEEILSPEDRIGIDQLDEYTDIIALKQALSKLDGIERQIIEMRYFCELTQNEVAKKLNTTQVYISRTEKKILLKMRDMMK